MIQRVTTHWRSIGTELLTKKYDTSKLGNIKDSNPSNHEQCCYDMFYHWINKYDGTWNDLLKALRSPAVGLNAVASDVEKGTGVCAITNSYMYIVILVKTKVFITSES